ncbi:hypothetical protein WDU94_015462 [Cyamophila willieti]
MLHLTQNQQQQQQDTLADNIEIVSLMDDETISQIESQLGLIFSGSPYQEEEALAREQLFGPTSDLPDRHILHEHSVHGVTETSFVPYYLIHTGAHTFFIAKKKKKGIEEEEEEEKEEEEGGGGGEGGRSGGNGGGERGGGVGRRGRERGVIRRREEKKKELKKRRERRRRKEEEGDEEEVEM